MKIVLPTIVLTALIELVTIALRFGAKLESTRDTASTVGKLTFGIRIHHGYIGVLMILLAMLFLKQSSGWRRWIVVIGLSLFFSDMIHHFLVLWPMTGSPEFHLVYPHEH